MQASASLPGVFRPTIIDGKPYVDGGLSINSPLMPAIAAGAEVIHVVFLDPKMRDIPMRVPLGTVTELYRMIAILFANETRAQIVQIDQLNRALRSLENPPREVQDENLAFLLTLDQLTTTSNARRSTGRSRSTPIARRPRSSKASPASSTSSARTFEAHRRRLRRRGPTRSAPRNLGDHSAESSLAGLSHHQVVMKWTRPCADRLQ